MYIKNDSWLWLSNVIFIIDADKSDFIVTLLCIS